jgi:hypothetical protein
MKFKTSKLKNKQVFLIGPAQNAQVEPHEYEDYDYVARLNMYLDCFDDPPRTDIVFLNMRASRIFNKNINKNLNNKIIFTKKKAKGLRKKYPTSVIINKRGSRKEKRGYAKKTLYMGSHAMNVLLKCGANVTYGGADFYYDGFGSRENYPPGYNFAGIPGKQSRRHRMKGDLNWIKNYLMIRFWGKLSMHEKTEYFFKKSLERYNIK